MSLLLNINVWPEKPWLARFRALLPDMEVVSAHAAFDRPSITYAAVWKPAHGSLVGLPNLKAILNLGAGVDHLLLDKTLPPVTLCRTVDQSLTSRMTEWIVMQCLMKLRRVQELQAAQARRAWAKELNSPDAHTVRIGVMGMGVLGADAATKLKMMGFDVAGWSNSGRTTADVPMFAGKAGLDPFLGRTDILVVLLPHTPETDDILNRALFQKLARDGRLGGPVLINAGRGGLQNEADILACLDDGTLHSAVLDVFRTEPLPDASPFWNHPKVTITPHNSADSDPEAVARYIARQIRLHQAGQPMESEVNVERGY
jgi:glyoxylate/hydroxypyruvate reductase